MLLYRVECIIIIYDVILLYWSLKVDFSPLTKTNKRRLNLLAKSKCLGDNLQLLLEEPIYSYQVHTEGQAPAYNAIKQIG